MTRAPGTLLGRSGLALPSAIFALVAVGVLVTGLFSIADLSAKAVGNRQSAARATQFAEAGLAHGLGVLRGGLRKYHFTRILRGFDNLAVATADDGRLSGYGLPLGEEIPDSGAAIQVGPYRGRYYLTLVDDDLDPDGNGTVAQKLTDTNGRLLARCRGETADGAVAEIEAIVGAASFPGIAVDGDLNFSGNPQILGACGGAHANGQLSVGGSNTIIETRATATGMVSGGPRMPSGAYTPKVGQHPPIDIPDLNPLDHCAGADYRLRSDGFIVVAATGQVLDATSLPVFGWKRSSASPVNWALSGDQATDGTFCVEGNAYVSGNTGSAAAPRKMSIIATGSIEVSGNPYLAADHDDGIMLLAGGDLSISGNPDVGLGFEGLMYAGAQCKLSGKPSIAGNIACANGSQPAGSADITATHNVSGDFTLRYDCSTHLFNRPRVLTWYPKVGV